VDDDKPTMYVNGEPMPYEDGEPTHKFSKLFGRQMTRKEFLAFCGILAVSIIPIAEVLQKMLESHASSPTVELEAENGTLAAPATVVTDSTASAGKAVQFGSASTPKTGAILTVGSATLTQADINTIAGWGFTGIVLSTDGNGQNFSFGGESGLPKFSGSPGTTRPAAPASGTTGSYYQQWQYRDIAGYCHNATADGVPVRMNVYGQITAFNNHRSPNSTGFIGPLLGSLNPSYTDPNKLTWADWYQMNEDLGDALVWMDFDGLYFDNEDVRVDAGTGESTWCAGYYENSFGASTTVAQERAWAEAAGSAVMKAINGGRSGTNGKNYPVINYVSSSIGRLGSFPGGCFTAFNKYFGNTATIDYQGSKTLATDVAMETYSSYLWFMKGLASATTGSVLFGDPFFYTFSNITHTGLPWYSSAGEAQCWTNAMAYNVSAFAKLCNGTTISGFTLPSNCFISPMIWPLDQTGYNGSYPSWSDADWAAASPALLAGSQNGMYMVWQYGSLTSGSSLAVNYANNVNSAHGGVGQNYTPLN
jgi:hypothetical protein